MNKTTKTQDYADQYPVEAAENETKTTVKFEDNEFVFFEPTKGGMQAVVKGQLLESFSGNFFNADFMDYLRENGISGAVQDRLYEAVNEGLRKALVMEAIMKCMK